MINLPKLRKCPCCGSANVISVVTKSQESRFRCLANYILKKKFVCRKCKEEIGIFVDNKKFEKLIWLNYLGCEENYYEELSKLTRRKNKLNKNLVEQYGKISNQIEVIQNKIKAAKIKLKIKFKIQHKSTIIDNLHQ